MSDIFMLDDDQLKVLKRVKSRLYDESRKLGIDEKRDLANAMDAILHNVETYGKLSDDDQPRMTLMMTSASDTVASPDPDPDRRYPDRFFTDDK